MCLLPIFGLTARDESLLLLSDIHNKYFVFSLFFLVMERTDFVKIQL